MTTKKKPLSTKRAQAIKKKIWGDASYLSRILTLALLVGAIGTASGILGGWFQGCQEDFEDNRINRRQDTTITAVLEWIRHDTTNEEYKNGHDADTNKRVFKRLERVEKELGIDYQEY